MYPNPLSAGTDVSVPDKKKPCTTILSDGKDIPQLVSPLATYKCDDAALMIAAQAITRLDDTRRARE